MVAQRQQRSETSFWLAKEQAARFLGEGANGIVALQGDGVTVVKRLKDATDAAALQLFRAEAELLAQLSHGHIVKAFGPSSCAAAPDQADSLAMEYVPGGSLQALLFRQMQSPTARMYQYRDALRWCTQLASALAYLHSREPAIVFRDLSAANVLLTLTVSGEADIKLIDFGLHKRLPRRAAPSALLGGKDAKSGCRAARAAVFLSAHSGERTELTGETGSYMYMSPEVVKCLPYNEKVDVFSLGCLMYELFSRQLRSAALLVGDRVDNVLKQHARKVADGYRPAMPRRFPEPLAELISACWAQRSRERPSAAAVLAQLEMMAQTGALDTMDARGGGLFACFHP